MDFFSLPTSRDHVARNAWIGPSLPLDLSALAEKFEEIPLEYPSLSQS
jgi:DOPA 4,5-dioxygenase